AANPRRGETCRSPADGNLPRCKSEGVQNRSRITRTSKQSGLAGPRVQSACGPVFLRRISEKVLSAAAQIVSLSDFGLSVCMAGDSTIECFVTRAPLQPGHNAAVKESGL